MKTYIVKYISDDIRKNIICNHIRLSENSDILEFIRNTYGNKDIYWRLLGS